MRTIFVLILLLITFAAFAWVTTNFNNGLEYWRIEGDSDYQWMPTGGNPGGCLQVDDYAVGDINRAYAPFNFLGDWSNADTTDYISMDIYLSTPNVIYIEDVNYVFEISGPGGDAWAIQNPYPQNHAWTTYSVNLNPVNWHLERGDWNSLLNNVQSFIVTVEYIEGDESDKLDNVYLSFSPIIQPVRIGTVSDFEQPGFDGWSFKNVSGVSNEISGGNPHRFIYVNGNSDFTTAIAAPKFNGSWHQLEDNAAILMDLKKISSNVDFHLPPYLFKISNDSSAAVYPCPSDINLRLNQWTCVSAMITESNWNVISGSWDDLMDNVFELRVALDFYNTQSEIGLDNFRVDNEPPEVHFTVDKREIYKGTQIHFTDLSTNSPESWNWLFGDGTVSYLQNPFHTYQNKGIYDVALTATNQFGSGQLVKNNFITVYDPDDDFYDDFEDGRINDLWELIRGNWREENGYLEQTSNIGDPEDLNEGCFGLVGTASWSNYEIRADILNLDSEGIGLVLDYQDQDNFYLFQMDRSNEHHIAIYRYQNGIKTLLVSENFDYNSNMVYHITFSKINGSLKATLGDNHLLSYTDTDRALSEGKSGVWCSGSTGARYYDYSVLFVPEKPQNLRLSYSGSNITIEWDSVTNAVGYNIYSSDDDDNFVLEVEGIPTTSWTGTVATDKKFFRVTAVK